VTLLFETTDDTEAKAFVTSDDLREAMKDAGVVGKPEIHFLKSAKWILWNEPPPRLGPLLLARRRSRLRTDFGRPQIVGALAPSRRRGNSECDFRWQNHCHG
jgi:hypothetical protein